MDYVMWIDENENDIGEVERVRAHREGLLHRVSAVFLFNERGEILIQERVDGRLDHSSAGHVDPDESYHDAAIRELNEELGIKGVSLNEVGMCDSEERYKGEHRRHRIMIYKAQTNPVVLNTDEVKSVFWENPQTILQKMKGDNECKIYAKGFNDTLVFYTNKNQS